MAKITLSNVASGYNRQSINTNFEEIETALEDKVLYRDNPTGEPNQMEQDIDMNGNSLLNYGTNLADDTSLITVGASDTRYVNSDGDSMSGNLDMGSNKLTNLPAGSDSGDSVNYQQLAAEQNAREAADADERNDRVAADADERNARVAADTAEQSAREAADASLQSQISGSTTLEASAFSEISYHGQTVENSVTIPDNKNAWSFGPTMSIAALQTVTVGTGSFWTIANGEVV